MRFFHKRIQYESFDGHGPLSRKKAERKRPGVSQTGQPYAYFNMKHMAVKVITCKF